MSNDRYRLPRPNGADEWHRARQVNSQADLTWLDYLRSAGGTVRDEPPSPELARSDVVDRKRRHTGSGPQQRSHPNPSHPSTGRVQSLHRPATSHVQQGSSREAPVDLTSPPPAPRPSFSRMAGSSNTSSAGRRESEVVLPRWQPDHEVTECPVCHNEFSLFHRRHHCRKCGRVVCSTCSPHRITIPRQYIVQPPSQSYEDEANPSSPSGSNPALGGGEVVRVCNPCVPDPWTPDSNAAVGPAAGPAAEQATPPTNPPPRRSEARPWHPYPGYPRHVPRDRAQTYQPYTSPMEWADPRSAERSRNVNSRSDVEFVTRMDGMQVQRGHFALHENGYRVYNGSSPVAIPSRPPPPSPPPRTPTPLSGRPPMVPHRPPPPLPSASASGPPAPPRAQEMPQRQVREEDECPVCGIELPPGEAVREAHIKECVNTRFSSTSSQQPRSAPPATEAVAPAPASRETASATPGGSRPRATSYRPRGMALYRATEKDCTTEDGMAQECVICFEEFEEGDEMGRMECLCKFHRACIRRWWDTKGQGSCPTHQLHD